LGAAAKNMNLNMATDEGELNGFINIAPHHKDKSLVARSGDYVVFMHFPEQLRNILLLNNSPMVTVDSL
jgi:hypothetical protein